MAVQHYSDITTKFVFAVTKIKLWLGKLNGGLWLTY